MRPGQSSSKAAGFDSLPAAVLSLIFERCSPETRRSLLQVSRLTRDTVLYDARSAALTLSDPHTPATRKPLARLLNRICSGRSQGLALILDATDVDDSEHLLLPSLLHYGLRQGGWQAVKEATLKGFKCHTSSLLVASALPALESLVTVHMRLSDMDLEHLSACTQLTSLKLDCCELTAETASSQAPSITSPLAELSSIRQLEINGVSSAIACGVTQLTSLHVGYTEEEDVTDILRCTSGMHNLQELWMAVADDWGEVSMPMLQQLVTTATQLRVLRLSCCLGQQEIDLLLTHATQLTRLTCTRLEPTEDRSQSACSWAELVACCGRFGELAYLPLHSVHRLESADLELPSSCPAVEITLDNNQEDQEFHLEQIRDAVTNLGRCPAWQQSGPDVSYWLTGKSKQFGDGQLLVSAVATLSGLANKQLELCISNTSEVLYDASLLEHLGSTVGSSLTHLDLSSGHLSRDFWPAVWAHLPGLQRLSLGMGKDTIRLEDVAAFCTHAPRPLQLCLHMSLSSEVGPAEKLQELSSAWGEPQVTVVFQYW